MKVVSFDSREDWLKYREGKITGSKLGDIVVKRGTGKKIGFYELLAERLAIEEDGDETPLERGQRLEEEALQVFAKETGKKVANDLVIWVSDLDPSIAYSPDGLISDREVAEVKCLSSARHLQAYFEKKIPAEYEEQYIQAFIVNEKLKTLYFVFYDPRVASKPIHWIEVHRKDVEDMITTYRDYQVQVLAELEAMVNELTY